jgi:hypothetical protein
MVLFTGPQTPFTTAIFAIQLTVAQLFGPVHCQFHGPFPVTTDAVPTVHRLAVGAAVTMVLFTGPQTPHVT